jgi:hypothetical protein
MVFFAKSPGMSWVSGSRLALYLLSCPETKAVSKRRLKAAEKFQGEPKAAQRQSN